MRCTECGATNADSADWCSQCYAALGVPEAPGGAPQSAPVPGAAPAQEQGAAPGESSVEGFRRRDGYVEWQCPSCGLWTPVEALACSACGTTIAARWERVDADRAATGRRLSEPWTAALALTAVVPGAGHIGIGRYAAGIARAVLYAVWLAGGVALWRAGGFLAGGPLLVGAGALWAGSLADVAALRAGRREVLGGRSLLWLVVGVLVLLLAGVFTTFAGASAGAG